MHHLFPAGALVLLLLMSAGCRRPAPQPPPPPASSAPAAPFEAARQPPPALPDTVEGEMPRMRPEQAAAAAAAAQRRQTPATQQRTAASSSSAPSVPETREQAVALMQTIDRDIAAGDLEPGAAMHLRAAFRGRLLSAGIDKETIEAWTAAKSTP